MEDDISPTWIAGTFYPLRLADAAAVAQLVQVMDPFDTQVGHHKSSVSLPT